LRLGQFHIERIDFVATHIADEESRTVRSEAAPRECPAAQTLRINKQFRSGLSDFDSAIRGVLSSNIVIDIISIPRPGRKEDAHGLIDPICPFLSLEVEDQELLGIGGFGSEMLAIRRQARTKQILGADERRKLLRIEIQNLNGDFLRASRDKGGATKNDLLSV